GGIARAGRRGAAERLLELAEAHHVVGKDGLARDRHLAPVGHEPQRGGRAEGAMVRELGVLGHREERGEARRHDHGAAKVRHLERARPGREGARRRSVGVEVEHVRPVVEQQREIARREVAARIPRRLPRLLPLAATMEPRHRQAVVVAGGRGAGHGEPVEGELDERQMIAPAPAATVGKIVVAGTTRSYRGEDFALARYNANGSLDASFGSGGKVTTDFAGDAAAAAFAVARQTDGKLVAAGGAKVGGSRSGYSRSGEDFALARYSG